MCMKQGIVKVFRTLDILITATCNIFGLIIQDTTGSKYHTAECTAGAIIHISV